MKLLYLTHANLADNLFIKDLVHNFQYPLTTKVLLLHEPFGNALRDTRFVTKRLSTLFSETMTYNNAFMGDQRQLFVPKPAGGFTVNQALIQQLLAPINMLLVGPIVAGPQGAMLADAKEMLQSAREALPIDEVILFASNGKSPLAQQRPQIGSDAELQQLLGVYEEERSALELAYALRPATLASPVNYAT